MKNLHIPLVAPIVAALVTASIVPDTQARNARVTLPPPGEVSTTIDNPWLPLAPGDTFAYRARTVEGCEYNKVTVTDDLRQILFDQNGDGIEEAYLTRIVRDQAWEDEDCDLVDVALVEDTEDYYAQDVAGNVWYFGEETWSPDEESAECSAEGAWEAGLPEDDPQVEPAQPGIQMLARPRPGLRYKQEFLEDVAEDMANVMRLNGKVSIATGEYTNCLVVREWTPLEPGAIEHKFYCALDGNPGPAGLMKTAELKGRNVYVRYIGTDFSTLTDEPSDVVTLPGENAPFPATASLGCTLPAP